MKENLAIMKDKLKKIDEESPQYIYVEDFIKMEIDNGYAFLNAGNNNSILKKMPKKDVDPLMYRYQSTAWNFIRGAWFYDYITELFKVMVDERTISLKEVATKAYDNGLSKYHPWILQKAARLGMGLCTTREIFLAKITAEQTIALGMDYTDDNVYEDVQILYDLCKGISEEMWSWARENGVDEVP